MSPKHEEMSVMTITIALIDDDQMVLAKTDLSGGTQGEAFGQFLRQMKADLLPGQTARLEIDGIKSEPLCLEITRDG